MEAWEMLMVSLLEVSTIWTAIIQQRVPCSTPNTAERFAYWYPKKWASRSKLGRQEGRKAERSHKSSPLSGSSRRGSAWRARNQVWLALCSEAKRTFLQEWAVWATAEPSNLDRDCCSCLSISIPDRESYRAWLPLNLPQFASLCLWCWVTKHIICKLRYYRITFSLSKGHTLWSWDWGLKGDSMEVWGEQTKLPGEQKIFRRWPGYSSALHSHISWLHSIYCGGIALEFHRFGALHPSAGLVAWDQNIHITGEADIFASSTTTQRSERPEKYKALTNL